MVLNTFLIFKAYIIVVQLIFNIDFEDTRHW